MSDVRLPSSPYKGLVPFSEVDASFFFGRERESELILANLRTRRLTLLYGPSGVGKSSVINAGIVYRLRQRAHERHAADTVSAAGVFAGNRKHPNFVQPIGARTDGGPRKRIIVIVFSNWVGDPLDSLRDTILAGLKDAAPDILQADAEEKSRALRLTEMLEQVTAGAEPAELLIILDQFEEYFVYHPADEGVGKFADEFSRAVVNLDLRAKFLISIREDWLARLDRFKGHIPNLFENFIRIDHLEHNAAREAIEKPIEKYNELVRNREGGLDDGPMEIRLTRDFTSEVLSQLKRLDGSDNAPRIQGPRLQIVLQHLWDRVKNDSPPTLGLELLAKPDTAEQIIQSNLHHTFEYLSRKEKLIAASLFPFLLTETGTKFASTAEGLADRSGFSLDRVRPLLAKLSERGVRILNAIAPSPGQLSQLRYELTSDVLAAPVIAWSKDIRASERQRAVTGRYILFFLVFFVIFTIGAAFMRARQQRTAAIAQAQLVEKERAKAQRALDAVRRMDNEIPYSKAVMRGHGRNVTSAMFTPDGHIFTASTDGSAILWDIDSKNPIREFNKEGKESNPLITAAINPKGDIAMTGSADGTVTLWNLANGDSIRQLAKRVGHHITGISFSPKGDFVAAANTTGEVTIWNTATGEPASEMSGKGEPIREIVFSPTGRFLAAASDDYTVRIWRSADWSEATTLIGHTDIINGLAFSADERFVATAGADTTIRVWDLSTGGAMRVLMGHAKGINTVAFDNEGDRLLSASDDTTARVWNVERSKSIQLIGHTDKVLSASFSPSGQQIVTASKDNIVRIWSASTGRSLIELRGHLDQVTSVTYSNDGKYILTGADDATARVWFTMESGNFTVDQPSIKATPNSYRGPCPVTISFLIGISAVSGSGTVVYRLLENGTSVLPTRELAFDGPRTKYVNWYMRITEDYSGLETIEVIEPKGIKAQEARFTVKCEN